MPKAKKKQKLEKPKARLTATQRKARRERKRNFMTVFINGKQKRVPRPPTIDGLPVEEFIARNAAPIWLHQHERWELMPEYDAHGERPSDFQFPEFE